MAMEIWRGTVADYSKPEGGKAECRISERKVVLNRDLETSLANGQEVVVSGLAGKDELQALAVNNLTDDKITDVDASNYVLALGASGFLFLLCLITSLQNQAEGEMTLAGLTAGGALVGLIGLLWSMGRMSAIRKASTWVKYPD